MLKPAVLKPLGSFVLALLLVLGVSSAPAFAHASLVSADPADGASMAKEPDNVTFTFSENVRTPAFIVVTAPDGTKANTGKVEAIDRTISASLELSEMKGTYTIAYRVVSADGHPVEGTSKFTVTTGRTVDQSTPATQQSFVHRHGTLLIWAGAVVVVAIALLLWPLRKKREDS